MPKETKVTQKCRETLKSVFGHEDYREGQEAIIEALLEGRDVLALLPTGAGKSLCFQLPALVKNGMAVVFEPLISLMKDQVDALKKKNVAAAYLSSNMEWDEISSTVELIRDEKIKILYVSFPIPLFAVFWRTAAFLCLLMTKRIAFRAGGMTFGLSIGF